MLNLTKKIFCEPLFHFLILGALIYCYFDYGSQPQAVSSKPTIILHEYELKQLAKDTNLQDQTLTLEYLKYRKILLEEAYSLQLYQEDPKITQLLLAKMEYIFKTDKQFKEPSQETLEQFYKKHISDYSEVSSLDLYTIKLDQNIDYNLLKKLSIIADLTSIAKEYKHITPKL